MLDQHAVLYSVSGEKFSILSVDELTKMNLNSIKAGSMNKEDLHIVGMGETQTEALLIQNKLEVDHGLKNNISSYL